MIKYTSLLLLLLVAGLMTIVLFASWCFKKDSACKSSIKYPFESYSDFKATLFTFSNLKNSKKRNASFKMLWNLLMQNKQIPFAMGDSVMFLYKGEAKNVQWAGDFSGWQPKAGTKIANSDIWYLEMKFPTSARLDYKVIVNEDWILDPFNPNTQHSGFGENSELRMPDWKMDSLTILNQGVERGKMSDNLQIISRAENLDYAVQYKVYTPYNYDLQQNLPVIYVTDGHEYADDKLGAMQIVLDNLIYSAEIQPIIAVFIDPRNPNDLSSNRRGSEYITNIKFANFVADELVKEIDSKYKTNTSPTARAILGTSLGGWNSAFFGLKRSGVFQLIGIHSPAFDNQIISDYQNTDKLPLKIFMTTGTISDTQDRALNMKAVLDSKKYDYQYIEVSEGHSWGSWRALLNEPLIYFFGNPKK